MNRNAYLRLTHQEYERVHKILDRCEEALHALLRATLGRQAMTETRGAARLVLKVAQAELKQGHGGDKDIAALHKRIREQVSFIKQGLGI